MKLYVNCKEYSELVSKGLDQPLSLWEKVLVKMHIWICPPCEHVEEQFTTMAEACRSMPPEVDPEHDNTSVLSNEACIRIKAALKNVPENSSH